MLENIKLHNYQFDGIKIQTLIRHKNDIKWKNLIDHPTIRRNYCLRPELSEFAKNFRLFKKANGQVIINLSIPYFLEGHNYLATPYSVLKDFKDKFFDFIGVDFGECKVLEFEFGAYESVDIDSKDYLKNIVGVSNLDLEKSNSSMKMFGDSAKGIHYKIYDAVANSKRKKTFSRGNYPSARLIKHELKITKTENLFGRTILDKGFLGIGMYDDYKEILHNYRQSLIFKEQVLFKPLGNDTTNIIFTCLKSLEHKFDNTIPNLINEVLESSDLSASQRSKRRKSILQLDKMYNQTVNR